MPIQNMSTTPVGSTPEGMVVISGAMKSKPLEEVNLFFARSIWNEDQILLLNHGKEKHTRLNNYFWKYLMAHPDKHGFAIKSITKYTHKKHNCAIDKKHNQNPQPDPVVFV